MIYAGFRAVVLEGARKLAWLMPPKPGDLVLARERGLIRALENTPLLCLLRHLNPKEISLPLAFLAVLFDHTTRKGNSLNRVHTDSPFTRTEDWKSSLDLGLPKPVWLFSALCCPLLVHNMKNQLPTLPTGLYFLWRMMMIMRKATLSI